MLRLSQTKDYKIGICCFFTKHVVLRRKSKNWLAKNQDNFSEWGDMCLCGGVGRHVSLRTCFKTTFSTIPIQLSVLI